jgi:hypothetical protein
LLSFYSLETSANGFDFKLRTPRPFTQTVRGESNALAFAPVSSLWFQTIAVSKSGRRHAGYTAKRARKIVLVLKPQVETHIENTKIRSLKKLLRARNAPVENVSVGAESGAFLEQGREIVQAQIRILSEVRERNVLAEMRVNVLEDAFQSRGGQARFLDHLASSMRRIRVPIIGRANRVRPSGFGVL